MDFGICIHREETERIWVTSCIYKIYLAISYNRNSKRRTYALNVSALVGRVIMPSQLGVSEIAPRGGGSKSYLVG
jgi:hypothetical protein